MRHITRSTLKSAMKTRKKPQSTSRKSTQQYGPVKSKHFENENDGDKSFIHDDLNVTSESNNFMSESEEPPKKKTKRSLKNASLKITRKSAAKKGPLKTRLPKGGEDSDDELWESFIPRQKTPDIGDVEYQNSTIHHNTLQFLRGFIT